MRAVVFANGILERPDLAAGLLRPNDFIISADGGLHHIRHLGLVPHLLIGDLDSISPQDEQWLREQQVEVRQFPVDKDFTDLELALQAALQKDFKNHPDRGCVGRPPGPGPGQHRAAIPA